MGTLARNVLRGAYLDPFSLHLLLSFFRKAVLLVFNFNKVFWKNNF